VTQVSGTARLSPGTKVVTDGETRLSSAVSKWKSEMTEDKELGRSEVHDILGLKGQDFRKEREETTRGRVAVFIYLILGRRGNPHHIIPHRGAAGPQASRNRLGHVLLTSTRVCPACASQVTSAGAGIVSEYDGAWNKAMDKTYELQ
jgi:hypothetical protein